MGKLFHSTAPTKSTLFAKYYSCIWAIYKATLTFNCIYPESSKHAGLFSSMYSINMQVIYNFCTESND